MVMYSYKLFLFLAFSSFATAALAGKSYPLPEEGDIKWTTSRSPWAMPNEDVWDASATVGNQTWYGQVFTKKGAGQPKGFTLGSAPKEVSPAGNIFVSLPIRKNLEGSNFTTREEYPSLHTFFLEGKKYTLSKDGREVIID